MSSSFAVLSGRRTDWEAEASVKRHNTIGTSGQRRRNITGTTAQASPDYAVPQSIPTSESPLYSHLEQSLQRHASLPARSKAGGWRARAAMLPSESSDILEDQSYLVAADDGLDVSAQWAALRGSSHKRSVSEAEGSRSGSGSSPTSPRTDNGIFASGAFASSASSAAGVRRHQSLNLHQHRQRQPSNFGPIGSPGRGTQYASGRPRVSSVGEEDHIEPTFSSRTPWSPTPEEAVHLSARHEHSGSSDGSRTSLPSPVATAFNLERKLADLQVGTGSAVLSEPAWATSPSLQPPQPPSRKSTPQLPPLTTSFGASSPGGPASAHAAVPWIGRNHASALREATHLSPVSQMTAKTYTATPGQAADMWSRERERLMEGNLQNVPRSMAHHPALGSSLPYFSAEHAQTAALLQQQSYQIQQLQAQVAARDASQWGGPLLSSNGNHAWPLVASAHAVPRQSESHASLIATLNGSQASPIDINAFAQSKGFNPPPHHVDLQPVNARFFVIKSYTEEDVHKSIKYSIWTSTALGNKRLDKAFRENAELGKIFLFFSVNSSGHFCGVAEMLTPVDETMDATVWAQSKWKGVLKVRWIYIRDVPNAALRHIRLSNTAEAKPVTSSRDTQEVPYEAGVEILRIFSTHQSKTSLLQDYSYYDTRERMLQTAVDTSNGNGHDAHAPRQTASHHAENAWIVGAQPAHVSTHTNAPRRAMYA